MKILTLSLWFVFLLTACAHEEDTKIKKALELAGGNRGELEKVLRHYSTNPDDSLKLKAARFLIANMPGHYTLGGETMENYRKRIYADSNVTYRSKKEVEISLGLMEDFAENCEQLPDVEYLSSVFLIRHIDASFEMKDKYAWLRDITFDIFLEYLLPYRLLYEKPDFWRDSLRVIPGHQSKRLFDGNGISSFVNFVHSLNLQETGMGYLNLIPDVLSASVMRSDCRMICYRDLFGAGQRVFR